MLSGELRAGIRTTSVLLFITAGLIVAAAVKNAIGDSKLFFLQSEIIILLLSIVNLLIHLYSYRQLYKEVEHDGYESEVNNRARYQHMNSKLKKVETVIVICAAAVLLAGFFWELLPDHDTCRHIITPSLAMIWFIFNLRQFSGSW